MSTNAATGQTCGPCAGWCGGKGKTTFKDGVLTNNPIWIQILGICSSLAVTNRLANALVMGVALIFVTGMSNLLLSLLRETIPTRIRMIVEMAVISTFVILLDQILKAFYWDMSRALGPYVGLIITNCIPMGRAEAFALQNRPLVSLVDGMSNGLGYAMVLAVIGFVRELLGTGQVLGFTVLHTTAAGGWYEPNLLLVQAPGAFFILGAIIALTWVFRRPRNPSAPLGTSGVKKS